MITSTALRQWQARATQWFLERVLGALPDVTVLLGGRVRQWTPYVRIEARALWAAEPRARKVRTLLRGQWQPGGGAEMLGPGMAPDLAAYLDQLRSAGHSEATHGTAS